MKIRTAAVTSPGKVDTLELTTPDISGREVVVKVHAVALCTLEQRIFSGKVPMPMPCIGGHEVAGSIEALGAEVDRNLWKVGDRVAVRMLYSCGECHECRSGRTNMCVHSQRKPVREGMLPGPGGLCDRIVVDSSDLYPIDDETSYCQASLTEPLSCVVHSIRRAQVDLADDVVVIGGGIMGQMHVLLSVKRGARVILSDPDPDRRELALRLGAAAVVDPAACDPVEKVKSLTSSRGADVVFNTTPIAAVVPQALAMVARHGRMVQYSSLHPDAPTPFSPQAIHNNEITIMGSISPQVEDFHTASRLISSHIVDTGIFIEKCFPFEQAQQAFEAAVRPGSFRIIITD